MKSTHAQRSTLRPSHTAAESPIRSHGDCFDRARNRANATTFSLAAGLAVPAASSAQGFRSCDAAVPHAQRNLGRDLYPDYAEFRDKNRSFDGLVAYQLAPGAFAADSKMKPPSMFGFLVSGNFFQVLGVAPSLGRGFRPDEDQVPGRDAVVVLGHDFWKYEFSADSSVIGRRVRLTGLDFTVIGVAPESFTGMDQMLRPAFFVPAMMGPNLMAASDDLLISRGKRSFTVKGRLKPGVSIPAADAEASAFAKAQGRAYPATNRAFGAAVRTERQTRIDRSTGD